MSRSIDQFTTPFSPAEAFCIGGIISACDVHTNETQPSEGNTGKPFCT